MPHFQSSTLELIVYLGAAVVLLFGGYRLGRLVGSLAAGRKMREKEEELFTTQRGFKNLYDQELSAAREQVAQLTQQVEGMKAKVEAYRKKAAGLGGLFSTANKRGDAMYALLLENEQLEEALYAQNEKLRDERTDALKEQLRSTGYRRTLMTQLLSDERIKQYVSEVMADQKALPSPAEERATNEPAREHEDVS